MSELNPDFCLAFGTLSNYLKRVRSGDTPRSQMLAKRSFLHRAILRYNEFYEGTESVVAKDNEHLFEVIVKLDLLVDRVNEIRSSGLLDQVELEDLENKLKDLIYNN
jgi:hypothetical protein